MIAGIQGLTVRGNFNEESATGKNYVVFSAVYNIYLLGSKFVEGSFAQLIKQRVPSSSIEVCLQKVIERSHVLFFGEENMVRNVLHNLTHKRQASFHALRRL